MLVQMDARPERTQAHMFLEDAVGSIAVAWRAKTSRTYYIVVVFALG
jgi:hypothetical protein